LSREVGAAHDRPARDEHLFWRWVDVEIVDDDYAAAEPLIAALAGRPADDVEGLEK